MTAMDDVLSRWPTAGSELTYDIGSEFYGETHARFGGDGTYRIWSTVTEGRARLDYEGRCDPGDVAALVEHLRAGALTSPERGLQGEDDALVRLAVRDDSGAGTVELWVSQIREQPAFDEAQQPVLDLIRRLSDGSILETGR